MYKVLKTAGYSSNVVVENTDTKANVIIGKVTMEVLRLLEKAGYKTGEGSLIMGDEWNLTISKEVAIELSQLTMKMKKPIRDQSKKAMKQSKREVNKTVDAMDVLLGLATYK